MCGELFGVRFPLPDVCFAMKPASLMRVCTKLLPEQVRVIPPYRACCQSPRRSTIVSWHSSGCAVPTARPLVVPSGGADIDFFLLLFGSRVMPVLDSRPTLEAPDDDPYLWLEEIESARVLDWVE